MHIIAQQALGIAIFCLLGTLVAVKGVATGAVLEWPRGSSLKQLVIIFNHCFLLVVNPLAGPYRRIRHPVYTSWF